MESKLAYIGISSIIVFFVTLFFPGSLGNQPGFDDLLIGKLVITYVVLGGVIPWLYLLEKTRGKVEVKQWAIYFIGCWLLAPYFLLKRSSEISKTL